MKEQLRQYRGPVVVGGLLVTVLAVTAVLAGAGPRGVLDPRAYDPAGAHALAALLERHGVQVTRTTDVPTTVQAAGADTTVFVPLPSLMSPEELQSLATLPGRLVVAEAEPAALKALSLDARVVGLEEVKDREPGCSDPVAANAGRVRAGGFAYRAPRATSCYPAGEGASLVVLDRVTLLGAADALTNDHLDEEGDAALGIGLLGSHPRLVWLVPSPTRAELGQRPLRSPDDLLPHWLHLVRWQLLLAGIVLALWRGRRLGRVVLEQLPVVVRASETVEGHGRLAQSAGARDTAAEALREASRRSLARLAHGGSVTPEVLTGLVAARTPRGPGTVHTLLYGPTPTDDEALVRLARDLDALAREALTQTLTREGAGT